MRLQCAMLYVSDLARMVAFYRDGAGLTVLPERSSEGWVEFDAGGVRFALHAIPAHIAADITISDPAEAREETPIKLIFEVADLDAARARLALHGAQLMTVSAWGSCDGLDPEGNVFQLVASNARAPAPESRPPLQANPTR
jgi:predicted enzyme related to lactoylglutathione lyase